MRNVSNLVMNQISESRVIRTWRSGGNSLSKSILFTIPIEYAKKYDLNEPSNVVVIPTDEGILLKKIEVTK
jgi:hypothetical protein